MEKRGTCALTSRIRKNICPTSKRAQVTIFIIIAIVIFVIGILVYIFFPQIKSTLDRGVKNPQTFIFECIEEEIEDAVEKVSLQGGSIEPENYILYDNEKVEYLCYTNEYYKFCVVQQPMLRPHIEKEIKNEIEDEVRNCFNSLKDSYEKKGYNVNLKEGSVKVELLPSRVVSTFNYSLTLTKDYTEKYDSFNVVLNNNLYELMSIANNILEWETTQGNSEPTLYMALYPYLKVEKDVKSDETKIYILTDKNTGNKFQFASRSLAFPPGI
ncbi:hypothetical protein KAT24_01595 [Candidatus Pacearchaeota archaeon]|nr:hypothetical protein [Candidatus Pacearchaeota archaeon]